MELNLKRFKVLIVVFLVLCIVAAVIVPATSYFTYGDDKLKNLGFAYTPITNIGYRDSNVLLKDLGVKVSHYNKDHRVPGVLHTKLLLPALVLEYVILLLLFAGMTFVIAVKKKAS